MVSDVPYRVICAWNAAMCSVGSELPSYASSIGRKNCNGIVHLEFLGRRESHRGDLRHTHLSSLGSYGHLRSFDSPGIESVESEESVSGSGKLWANALGASSERLAAPLEGA
ncbi:hypothetical protein B296_00028429 [Ensete ventricosum]|uniref:Uncharacterized protein n=1 Tax=Ensete ventricosum TaxID=4639 RepID=A0A427A196_ENSVE|nr:hypothetical protein B296_00028429 [Ensete ventricosum]